MEINTSSLATDNDALRNLEIQRLTVEVRERGFENLIAYADSNDAVVPPDASGKHAGMTEQAPSPTEIVMNEAPPSSQEVEDGLGLYFLGVPKTSASAAESKPPCMLHAAYLRSHRLLRYLSRNRLAPKAHSRIFQMMRQLRKVDRPVSLEDDRTVLEHGFSAIASTFASLIDDLRRDRSLLCRDHTSQRKLLLLLSSIVVATKLYWAWCGQASKVGKTQGWKKIHGQQMKIRSYLEQVWIMPSVRQIVGMWETQVADSAVFNYLNLRCLFKLPGEAKSAQG